jgi:hypothetical protein
MIAMADFDVSKQMMTVQQVMDAIGARAPSTVTRAIASGRLKAMRFGESVWLIYRSSVAEMLAKELEQKPTGGCRRGSVRQDKPAKKAAKKSRRKTAR